MGPKSSLFGASCCWTEAALESLHMRLFVGIPLAATVASELTGVVTRLRRRDDGLRWTTPDSWHITLQFLGDTKPEKYECLVARLKELRLSPVAVRMEQLGLFQRSGILYAGVKRTPELLALAEAVVAATGQCGFAAETRPYSPHITLARSKVQRRGQPLDALQARLQRQAAFSGFVAKEFLLYESQLLPEGARYSVRERFALGGLAA